MRYDRIRRVLVVVVAGLIFLPSSSLFATESFPCPFGAVNLCQRASDGEAPRLRRRDPSQSKHPHRRRLCGVDIRRGFCQCGA